MDDLYRSQFRLPWWLYEELKKKAEAAGRSLNAEVVRRLETSLETEEFLNQHVADPEGQAAVLEVMTLIRQLDVVDLIQVLRDVMPALPPEIVDADPALKANLKMVRMLMRRLTISSDQASRIKDEYDAKYRKALDYVKEDYGQR